MAEKRKPNSLGVTIYDLAREVGVHPSTVSRALDPEQRNRVKESTRDQILDTAERLRYRRDLVAGGLRRGRTDAVGVVVGDIAYNHFTPIIRGLGLAPS